jgi:hypothetical protein
LLFFFLSFFFAYRQLVLFIEDTASPVWKGYLYAGILFLSMQLQSFFFHQLFHQSTSLGLRLRSCIISTVFRKVSNDVEVLCEVAFFSEDVLCKVSFFFEDALFAMPLLGFEPSLSAHSQQITT